MGGEGCGDVGGRPACAGGLKGTRERSRRDKGLQETKDARDGSSEASYEH